MSVALDTDAIPHPPTMEEEMPEVQWFLRGEWIVEHRLRGEWTNLTDLTAAVTPYLEHCRRKVYVTGSCSSEGCCDENLEPDAMGRLVCFRTRQPCMRLRLRAIVDLWSDPMSTAMKERTERTATEIVPKSQAAKIMAIDELRRDAALSIAEAERDGNDVLKAFVLARSMRMLRDMLTDEIMSDVMALMNTPMGFLTDRDPARGGGNPYPVEVVRDCAITALLQGFRLVGNEINIIGGRMYAAKDGCKRKVEEWPGLHDLRIDLGVPKMHGDGAIVSAVASWSIDDRHYVVECSEPVADGRTPEERMDTRLAIKVNKGMGADAILGKARRKLYARVLERLTGVSQDDQGAVYLSGAHEAIEAPEAEAETLSPGEQLGEAFSRLAAMLESVEINLEECELVGDVKAVVDRALDFIEQLDLPEEVLDDGRDKLAQLAEARKEAIRKSRGERSNA